MARAINAITRPISTARAMARGAELGKFKGNMADRGTRYAIGALGGTAGLSKTKRIYRRFKACIR
jgi:hypothetical protein